MKVPSQTYEARQIFGIWNVLTKTYEAGQMIGMYSLKLVRQGRCLECMRQGR